MVCTPAVSDWTVQLASQWVVRLVGQLELTMGVPLSVMIKVPWGFGCPAGIVTETLNVMLLSTVEVFPVALEVRSTCKLVLFTVWTKLLLLLPVKFGSLL